MAFCTQCGNKLKPGSKFCAECGSAIGKREPKAEAEARETEPKAEEREAKAGAEAGAGQSKAAKPSGAVESLAVIVGIIIGLWIVYAIAGDIILSDLGLASNLNENGLECAEKSDSVTCGLCESGDKANYCFYCPSGSNCSGNVCTSSFKCVGTKNGTANPTPIVGTPTAKPTTQPTAKPTGYGYIPNPPIDPATGCPPQDYNGPRGAVNLQCSQWIEAGRCSFQSCSCYYATANGDTAGAYYHTSDGAYYRCSGSGQTLECTQAALAVAQHCGPATDNTQIVWGS